MVASLETQSTMPIDATEKTLVILGCGALGTAILSGILSSSAESKHAAEDANLPKASPILPFTRYVACVRRTEAADAVRSRVEGCAAGSNWTILTSDNLRGVTDADVVVLAVQPHMVGPLFTEPGLKEALVGKLIISVVAGVSTADIESYLQSSQASNTRSFVIRAMPNTACMTRQSTTVIERPEKDFPTAFVDLTETLFQCVGQTFQIDPSNMNVCTALCGSTPAFFTLILEGLVDGAISLGLNHAVALQMAAHSMLGTASMALSGMQPQVIRHDVCSPGGSSIQGVLALEDGRVRSCFANALRVATLAATKLGTNQRDGKFD